MNNITRKYKYVKRQEKKGSTDPPPPQMLSGGYQTARQAAHTPASTGSGYKPRIPLRGLYRGSVKMHPAFSRFTRLPESLCEAAAYPCRSGRAAYPTESTAGGAEAAFCCGLSDEDVV